MVMFRPVPSVSKPESPVAAIRHIDVIIPVNANIVRQAELAVFARAIPMI